MLRFVKLQDSEGDSKHTEIPTDFHITQKTMLRKSSTFSKLKSSAMLLFVLANT